MPYTITQATEADVPELLDLIVELAVYEKEPDAVKATPELVRDLWRHSAPGGSRLTTQMIENVFKRKHAECLILRYTDSEGSGKGEAVGLALYFFTFSTWLGTPGLYVSDSLPDRSVDHAKLGRQLEDLYIKEKHRGGGQGKRLFGELGAIAKERGCSRVEWRVLKWNQPSIDFYVECLKAVPQSEWEGMRIEGEAGIERLIGFRQ